MFNCTSEKKHIVKFGLEFLGFFSFINFFIKALINQEHYLLPGRACGSFTYACCENCMPGFSVFLLNISKYSGNILFKSMPNANCLFISTYLVGANSLAYEHRVMAVAELHVTVTYYAQHSASKSVYEKVNQKSVASYFHPIGQFFN